MALTVTEKVYYLCVAALLAGLGYAVYRFVHRFLNDLRIDGKLAKIPSPPGAGALPFIGHLLQLNEGRPWDRICLEWPRALASPLVKFNMFRSRVLLVTEPALIQRVLHTQQRKYQKHADSFEEFMCILGTGLVTSEGAKWRHGRTLLSSAIRIEILEELPEIAISCTDLLLKRLAESKQKEFDLMGGFHKLTLQVIGRALLSLSPDECENVFARLYLPIVDECNARVWSPWRKWMPWTEGYQAQAACLVKLNDYFTKMIRTRWAERQSGARDAAKGVKQDILDLYMSQLTEMNNDTVRQLRDDLKTMVLAGHETTAAMLTWTMYELLSNPGALQKVRDEYKAVFGGFNIGKGAYPTLKELEKLKFTRACLREALRKYSVVPIVMRVAVDDDYVKASETGSYGQDLHIPKGTAISVGITSVHQNPQYWPEPQAFKPERMLPLDDKMDSVQYSFVPFSAGPRNCMGQHLSLTESQFIVAYLVSHIADLALSDKASGKPHKYVVPVVPENGLPVTFGDVSMIR